ncbi:MAG: DUF1579 domain-containing protein [Planctomycetaceae bacterium]|nr:DUF1579 domain-containing protein [Planctomycetaceae bacterium]
MSTGRGTAVALVACCMAAFTFAQERKEPAPADQEAFLKRLATPGEHHERLGPLAGKWKLAVKWRSGPADKWAESAGTAEYQWILGRRFLQESFQYDMGSQSLAWLGVYGYDNYQKQYTAVWVDNMGTNTEFASAQYDQEAKTFTFLGEQDDPLTKGKRKFKWIITLDGPDSLRFDSYDQNPPGTYYKNTEIIATRQAR